MALSNVMAQAQLMADLYNVMQQGYSVQYNGCPQQRPCHQAPEFPHRSWGANLPDSPVGERQGLFTSHQVEGYGVDMNRNGSYDRGRDGVLAFDLNHDGQIDDKEVQGSNERLKAFGGNYDLNGDGKVNLCERIKASQYQQQMQGMDANRDGKFSTSEISNNGGRVCIDRNRDGQFDAQTEQYSPYSFPTAGGRRSEIGYVDPHSNYTQINHWGKDFSQYR